MLDVDNWFLFVEFHSLMRSSYRIISQYKKGNCIPKEHIFEGPTEKKPFRTVGSDSYKQKTRKFYGIGVYVLSAIENFPWCFFSQWQVYSWNSEASFYFSEKPMLENEPPTDFLYTFGIHHFANKFSYLQAKLKNKHQNQQKNNWSFQSYNNQKQSRSTLFAFNSEHRMLG